MRWWFTALMAGAVLATPKFLGIHLPTAPLLSIVAALAAWNLVSHWWTRHRTVGLLAVALAIWVDLAALAGLLYFSGGATNPLVSMLILPVVAGLLSLTPAQALCIAAGSVLSYSWLMTQFVALHVHDETNASHLHLYGMWVTFVVSIATVTWLVLRLSQALRERAAELDAIRERALRDERIVTIGTLAAGAAHELGTPLSTMAVVVDDLRSAQGHSEDVQADLAMLDEQIAECKRIVGRLTEKADVSRSAGAQRVLAGEWLSALTGQWQTCSPEAGKHPGPCQRRGPGHHRLGGGSGPGDDEPSGQCVAGRATGARGLGPGFGLHAHLHHRPGHRLRLR